MFVSCHVDQKNKDSLHRYKGVANSCLSLFPSFVSAAFNHIFKPNPTLQSFLFLSPTLSALYFMSTERKAQKPLSNTPPLFHSFPHYSRSLFPLEPPIMSHLTIFRQDLQADDTILCRETILLQSYVPANTPMGLRTVVILAGGTRSTPAANKEVAVRKSTRGTTSRKGK